MAEVGRALVAAALFACAMTAQATPFGDAMEAIRADDCDRLGEVVNRHLDTSTSVRYLAGAMFEEGVCVERDSEKAARYYAAGDERRDGEAARDMGFEYVTGKHLKRSYARAGAWFVRSLSLRADPAPEVKLPPGIPQLPLTETSIQSEWAGYVVSVGFIGSRTLRYPSEALRLRAEGNYIAKVCVRDGTVSATALSVEPGPSAGVARVQGKREIFAGIEESYERVMKSMPPPSSPAPGPLCFNQPLSFRIR